LIIPASGSRDYQIPYTASGSLSIRAEYTEGWGDNARTYTATTYMDVTGASPSLNVTPEGRHGGQQVTVTAEGFAPNEYIYFYKKGSYINNKQADQDGKAVNNITLAANDEGPILFEAEGYTSDLKSSAIYQAAAANLSLTGPESVYSGAMATFTLTGVSQAEYFDFFINGVSQGWTYAYAGQSHERSLALNQEGSAVITAIGLTTGKTASFTCEVKRPAALNPALTAVADNYNAGSVVSLNATGFKSNETIKFYVNNVQVDVNKTADGIGSASASYTVAAANLVFSATGQTSGLTAVYSVGGVTTPLGVSAAGSPKPGQQFTATITGA